MTFPAAGARGAGVLVITLLLGLLAPVAVGALAEPAAAEDSCFHVQEKVPATLDDDARYEIRLAVACLVNHERAAWGLPSLTGSAMLDGAATLHNDWMGSTHTFSHDETGPGSHPTPGDRATASGYQWGYIAENVAAGQTTPYEVVDGWLHSPAHCRNLMSPEVADLGLAVSNASVTVGGTSISPVWTQVLGRWSGSAAPSDDAAALQACAAGQGFPARSEAFMDGAFTITETDLDGQAVDGPDETATVDPDVTVAMEREFTLTNDTSATLRNPGFRSWITDRPVEQDYLETVNVTCFADDPDTAGYALVETGCATDGDSGGYVPATVPPGRSVKVRVGTYNGPSSTEHVGEKTGWRIRFTGRYTDFGELIPTDSQPSFSQIWTWRRSHTGVGFDLRSASDGKPWEPDVVIGANGTGTWTVPVVNSGPDAYPKRLTIFIDAARGATLLGATMHGVTCASGTSFESNHRAGLRCDLPAGYLTGKSTRDLVVRAKAASTAPRQDRGAIGVQLGDPEINESFGTDTSIGGWTIDVLPDAYPGVRSGRVDPATDNIDDQARATGFCRTDDDCDLNGNGVADHDEKPAKKSAALTVTGKGGKKKATFSVSVKSGGRAAGGTVTVLLGGKTVKKATLRGGKATLTLTRQKKGKRTYTVRYSGSSTTRPATKTVRLTIS